MHPQQLKKKASRPLSSSISDRISTRSNSYLKTRIRGSRLLNPARILVLVELSRRLHQAYRFAYDKQAADQLLPQKSDQQQVVCKSKLPEKAARAILEAADKANIDPTLLSVTWRYESDFGDSPKPNPRYQNGKLVGYDVGPLQLSTNYFMAGPFTDGLPKAFTGNSFRFPNPFGPSKPNLDDFHPDVGFNGDVSQNLLAGARAFALDILPRSRNLADAAGTGREVALVLTKVVSMNTMPAHPAIRFTWIA